MNLLTRQEWLVLGLVIGLLLTGWAVKTYRLSHQKAHLAQQIQAAMPSN